MSDDDGNDGYIYMIYASASVKETSIREREICLLSKSTLYVGKGRDICFSMSNPTNFLIHTIKNVMVFFPLVENHVTSDAIIH